MAPELLNPSQFSLANGNPSTESDIYSLAMTAYEVPSSHTGTRPLLTSSLCDKVLTGVLPYGDNRDGIIIFHVVTGERPTRPADARQLQDRVWVMIEACWNERRGQRWGVHAVYDLFSTSSIQEVPGVGPGNQRASQRRHRLKGLLPVHRFPDTTDSGCHHGCSSKRNAPRTVCEAGR